MADITKTFSTYAQAKKYIHNVAEAYTTIYDCHYIVNDADIHLNGNFASYAKECKSFNWSAKLYLRTRGAEDSFARLQEFSSDHCIAAFKIEYTAETKEYNVTLRRAN